MTQYEIEKLASSILLSAFDKVQFPVNLYKIIEFLKIEVIRDDLKGESGYILHRDGNYRIFLSNTNDHNTNHLRFTLAHEISHILLGHLEDRRHLPHWKKESEANRLASALLMPFHFTVAYRHYPTSVLANFMAVSGEAMEIRLKEVVKDPHYQISIKLYKPNLSKDYDDQLKNII